MLKQAFTTIAIVCVSGCGGSSATTDPIVNTPPPVGAVSVQNNFFSPTSKAVTAGMTVQWAWNSCTGDVYNGQTCVAHNIVFDDGVTSGLQDHGSYTRMFATAGTYNYHCAIHGAVMSGSITVN